MSRLLSIISFTVISLTVLTIVFFNTVVAESPTTELNFSPIQQDDAGIAIGGYDAVSYFDANAAQQGRPEFQCQYQGATWYFSTPENRDRFMDNPEQFAPQFGGFCSHSISNATQLIHSDPEAYLIRDNKLFLYSNNRLSERDAKRDDDKFADLFEKRKENWFEYEIGF